MDGYTPSPIAAAAGESGSARFRDRKHLVNTEEKLAEFCREFIQMPLDQFLSSLE